MPSYVIAIFNIVQSGDFERGEFIGDSEKQIYVCTVIDT